MNCAPSASRARTPADSSDRSVVPFPSLDFFTIRFDVVMRFITDDPKQKSLPIVESSNKKENPLKSDKNISLPLTYNRMAKEN